MTVSAIALQMDTKITPKVHQILIQATKGNISNIAELAWSMI